MEPQNLPRGPRGTASLLCTEASPSYGADDAHRALQTLGPHSTTWPRAPHTSSLSDPPALGFVRHLYGYCFFNYL